MAKIYQYDMKVPFDMSDVNGFIKMPQLILLSLQVSGMQSMELGVSDRDLLEQRNLVWIITDYDITVHCLPVFDEQITIETQALAHNRLFCYRSFVVRDQKGQAIVEMVATFVLMDRDSRKVQSVPEEITEPYDSPFEKKIRRGPRYPELNGAMEQDYHVRFYDLDMNGHVNNSKYLDWVFEVMGAEFLSQHIPKRVHLKYVKEVLPGGMITSSVEREGMVSNHLISSEGQIHAQALITWEEIEKETLWKNED